MNAIACFAVGFLFLCLGIVGAVKEAKDDDDAAWWVYFFCIILAIVMFIMALIV